MVWIQLDRGCVCVKKGLKCGLILVRNLLKS